MYTKPRGSAERCSCLTCVGGFLTNSVLQALVSTLAWGPSQDPEDEGQSRPSSYVTALITIPAESRRVVQLLHYH